MNSLFGALSQGWIGTLVGIAGILLAIAFYLRSRRRARLAYQFDEVMLIGGRGAAFPEEVEIRFSGTPVPRITASRVAIWNCGDRTVNGADVVASDPLRIVLPDNSHLLKHSILRVTRNVNGWNLEPSGGSANQLLLKYDYLDPGDGLTLEVVHTGQSGRLRVAGTIRGMPRGVRNYGRASWFYASRRRGVPFPMNQPRVVFGLGVVVGIGIMLSSLLRPQLVEWFPKVFGPGDPDPNRYARINWALAGLGFLYMLLPALMLWSRRRRYPSTLEPEDAGGSGDDKSSAS